MTPNAAKSQARRFLKDSLTIIRNQRGNLTPIAIATGVRGRMVSYIRERGATDNRQGWQTAIVYVDDLIAKTFPIPMQTGDIIKIQGRTVKVMGVDQNKRKVGTTVICYECETAGS